MELDHLIHEPARLLLMTLLSGVTSADFTFLLGASGLTKGNLSSHLARLEHSEYVAVEKSFRGKIPHTEYRLTPTGRAALAQYWAQLDAIRARAQADVERMDADMKTTVKPACHFPAALRIEEG